MRTLVFLLAAVALAALSARADLHDPANSADYLIVTTQDLISGTPWIGQLADWRDSHGRTAMVVATEDIWNEFGNGTPSDTVLKEFFHFARESWTPPQLRDVFIIGFHDVVPSHIQNYGSSDSTRFLSDLFYATSPQSSDLTPLISIGRLPWSPDFSDEPWAYYDKIVAYENAPRADWQTQIQVIADSSLDFLSFIRDFAEPFVANLNFGYSVERDYVEYPPGTPDHGDLEEVVANLDSGKYIAAYFGLGNGDQWSSTLQVDSAHLATLSNGERLPIIVGMANDVAEGSLELGGIPAAFLANPNGGAIGYVACTSVAWAYSSIVYKDSLARTATSDSAASLGDIWRMTLAAVADRVVPMTVESSMLFGDPGLRLPPRPTAAEIPQATVPQEIRLIGNYPNPFNASTRIAFELPTAAHVSLRVYDLLGCEVAVLQDGMMEAGTHRLLFDAHGRASGIYFVRLETGSFSQTKKMMLLK